MNAMEQRLMNCLDCVRRHTDFVPDVALVLGSGLGGFADLIDVQAALPYSDIEGFPVSTVPGHVGRFLFGTLNGVKLVVMQGRIHYYEGYDMAEVVLPIRLMKLMGAKTLILTNAAGGINYDFHPGDFMLITDHFSAFVPSPLRGANLDMLGPRFCDMSRTYTPELCDIARACAKKLNINLREGAYLQFPGPMFETPLEIRAFRQLGADAVGMSTACEAIAASHMGMDICAISCITNMACGMTGQRLSHEEVQVEADKAAPKFRALLSEIITAIGNR